MVADLWDYLVVFFVSMLPIIELRGAIPIGVGLGLPLIWNFILSAVGNCLPVPFILIFIRKILDWMKKTNHFSKIAIWIEQKAQNKSDKVLKYASFGLLIFVAIPLPGTGAWTGALIASMLNVRFKYALPAIFAGVIIAGFIVTAVSYGFLGFLKFLVV